MRDAAPRPLVFVVGTGRTGSTALSRILSRHPAILSMNELLVSLNGPESLPLEPISGTRFWELLARPHDGFNEMIRQGKTLSEILYTRAPGRFSAETTGIPAISLMVLPHLTDDPDGLYDELAARVPGWPVQPAERHLEQLFDTLAIRFGRRVVVERSGRSLSWVPPLRQAFPYARFVHMYRDGSDCALSMSGHLGYRGTVLVREVLARAGVTSVGELTDDRVRGLPAGLARWVAAGFDADLTRRMPIPPAWFGALWSEMVIDGIDRLTCVPEELRTTLGFDDLLADPDRELTRLMAFAGLDAPTKWLAEARTFLDRSRSGTARRLPPAELDELRASCGPGVRALAAARAAGH